MFAAEILDYKTKKQINDCGFIKILYVNCGLRNKYESNLRNIEHFLSSSETKALRGLNP